MNIQFVQAYTINGVVINDRELLTIERDIKEKDEDTGEVKVVRTDLKTGRFRIESNFNDDMLFLDMSPKYGYHVEQLNVGVITRVTRNGRVIHVNEQSGSLKYRKYFIADGVEYNVNDLVEIITTEEVIEGRIQAVHDKLVNICTSDNFSYSNASVMYDRIVSISRM